MRKTILSFMLFMSCMITSFAQTTALDKDNLRDRIQNDAIFKKLLETKQKQIAYTQNGYFGEKNTARKATIEQLKAAPTSADKVKLYENLGMKNAQTYVQLNDDFRRYSEQLKLKYPELKQLSKDEFSEVFKELLVLVVATNIGTKSKH